MVKSAAERKINIEVFMAELHAYIILIYTPISKGVETMEDAPSFACSILDWALIDVQGRMGTNEVTSLTHVTLIGHSLDISQTTTYGAENPPFCPGTKIATWLNPGRIPKKLCKVGRTTSYTRGIYNELATAHLACEFPDGVATIARSPTLPMSLTCLMTLSGRPAQST